MKRSHFCAFLLAAALPLSPAAAQQFTSPAERAMDSIVHTASAQNHNYQLMRASLAACPSCGSTEGCGCSAAPMIGGCDSGLCGTPVYQEPACQTGCGCWFGSVGGLLFTRDNDDDVLLTFAEADGATLLSTRSADMNWAGGFEARVGRYYNCGRRAIEVAYWTLFPDRESAFANPTVGNNIFTPLRFDSLFINDGTAFQPVANLFNVVDAHRLVRSYNVQNVEVNVMGLIGCGSGVFPGASGCGPTTGAGNGCATFSWTIGPRWFRFSEGLLFGADPDDAVFDGDANEVNYLVDVTNDLLGLQAGARGDWPVLGNFGFYCGVRGGLYANRIRQSQQITTGAGQVAFVDDPNSPFDGSIYSVSSSKNDVAFLGEIDLGANVRLTQCLSAALGYRVVAANGVALAPSQIPRDFFDNIAAVREIDSNGSLLLHGAYAGVYFNY